jgi:gliding motility-associated-like protein
VYEYDGKNETNVTTASTYTYTKPGIYTVLQLGEYKGLPLRACAIVWAYDTLPPVVKMTACGNQVKLLVNDVLAYPGEYDYILIYWGDGQTDTLRKGQTEKEHTLAGSDSRLIQVQGIHEVGNCGGTARLTFTPNQPPIIQSIEPVQAGTPAVRLQIQNPSGLALTLQQRVGNAAFTDAQALQSGTSVSIQVPADTSQTTCYRVVPANNCPGSGPSPEVCHTFPPTKPVPISKLFYFPDAFSPNNDGMNDVFGPIGAILSSQYQLTIFDRWGQVVFATNDQQGGWDGLVNGNPAPVGAYTYQVEATLLSGEMSQNSGRLQLIR